MKRAAVLLLALCLLLPGLAGCRGRDTLTIRMGSTVYPAFESALQAAFPDIRFEIEHYVGPATTAWLRWSLISGNASDLYFNNWVDLPEEQAEHLLDLSGYEFVGNYDPAVLDFYDVDGHLYELPGPYTLRAMVYNKTLFAERGWSVPKSHEELVALCRTIRRESGLTPITFAGSAPGYNFTYMTTLSQGGFLSSPNGVRWEEAYFSGRTSTSEGFGEGIRMLEELIAAEAFQGAQTVSLDPAGAAGELTGRRAAMMAVFQTADNVLRAADASGSGDEFGMFPFYGADGSPVLGAMPGIQFGVSKALAEEGSERKLKNALRVMEWLATPEAQDTFRASDTQVIPLRDTGETEQAAIIQDVAGVIAHGYTALMLYNGYLDIMLPAGSSIQKAIAWNNDLSGLAGEMDAIHAAAGGRVVYGEIDRDFTLPETVQTVCDAIHAAGLADFTLLSLGTWRDGVSNPTGCAGPLFRGEVSDHAVSACLNGDARVCVLALTGAQVRELLESGRPVTSEGRTASFEYYWSGLEVTLRSGHVRGAALGGAELADEQVYRVAMVEGDWPEELSGLSAPTEITAQSLWEAWLALHRPLTPSKVLR